MATRKAAGDKHEILVLAPPAPAEVKRLLGLYKLWDRPHAEGTWARDLALRLGSGLEGAHDRFYMLPHGRKIASALDVSRSERSPGFGIAHRVFTHPKMRRRGLASSLMARAKEDFRASGGRILLVVAPAGGAAGAFYAAQGFREVVRARDGEAMLGWAARGRHVREAVLRLLRQKLGSWRGADAGDWAGLVAHSSLPGGRPDAELDSFLDAEWGEVFERLAIQGTLPDEPEGEEAGKKLVLEVGESRRGFIVAARATGAVPKWLRESTRSQ